METKFLITRCRSLHLCSAWKIREPEGSETYALAAEQLRDEPPTMWQLDCSKHSSQV
jgi:hypothetical protein